MLKSTPAIVIKRRSSFSLNQGTLININVLVGTFEMDVIRWLFCFFFSLVFRIVKSDHRRIRRLQDYLYTI